ncbi:MAG: hypothetical protein BWY21_00982 [Parcubacteria group bacterium ADurb.Bin216]|nr:MAG: hypothetical protein BWY21_00982 [Parcubacteria group bacterium ADurb.Bin216]
MRHFDIQVEDTITEKEFISIVSSTRQTNKDKWIKVNIELNKGNHTQHQIVFKSFNTWIQVGEIGSLKFGTKPIEPTMMDCKVHEFNMAIKEIYNQIKG